MSAGNPGIDFPEPKTVVDVHADSRSDVLTGWVETGSTAEIALTAPQDRTGRRVRLDVGARLQVVWKGPAELRELPAEVVATGEGAEPIWRLRPLGPASRAQRRESVRAPLSLPVRLQIADTSYPGSTVDVSEGGLRCALPDLTGSAAQAAVGTVFTATLELDADEISAQVQGIRLHARDGGPPELSLRFIDLGERAADRIRARVFTRLRELRARGVL